MASSLTEAQRCAWSFSWRSGSYHSQGCSPLFLISQASSRFHASSIIIHDSWDVINGQASETHVHTQIIVRCAARKRDARSISQLSPSTQPLLWQPHRWFVPCSSRVSEVSATVLRLAAFLHQKGKSRIHCQMLQETRPAVLDRMTMQRQAYVLDAPRLYLGNQLLQHICLDRT